MPRYHGGVPDEATIIAAFRSLEAEVDMPIFEQGAGGSDYFDEQGLDMTAEEMYLQKMGRRAEQELEVARRPQRPGRPPMFTCECLDHAEPEDMILIVDNHLPPNAWYQRDQAQIEGRHEIFWHSREGRWPASLVKNDMEAPRMRGYLYEHGPAYVMPDGWEAISFPPAARAQVQHTVHIYYNVEKRIVVLPFYLNYYLTQLDFDASIGAAIKAIAAERTALTPEQINEREVKYLADALQGRGKMAVATAQNAIEEWDNAVMDRQQELHNALERLNAVTEQLRHAEAALASDQTVLPEVELASLRKHAQVDEVRVGRSRLLIKTPLLYLTHPDTGARCPLGVMQISLPTKNEGQITVRNLTNPQQARPHPHVSDNGVCWGDIEVTVNQALASREYIGALDLLIQYLESFNPKDANGKFADAWFAAAKVNPDEDTSNLSELEKVARELGISKVPEQAVTEAEALDFTEESDEQEEVAAAPAAEAQAAVAAWVERNQPAPDAPF